MNKVDLIIQGPIYNETSEAVSYYLKELNFVNKIIISSWEGENFNLLPQDNRIIKIASNKPTDPGTGNRNYQIVSSYEGLLKATSDVSVKLRSDQIYYKASMDLMYLFYNYSSDEDKDKIFISGIFDELLFHPKDHLFWGKTDNLRKLFNIPLEEPSFQKTYRLGKHDLWRYYSKYQRTETYIGSKYASLFDDRVKHFIDNEEDYLYDNCKYFSEALSISKEINNKIFKLFPKECCAREWREREGFAYPYDIQEERFGESWAKLIDCEESFLLKQLILSEANETSCINLLNFYGEDYKKWGVLLTSLDTPYKESLKEISRILPEKESRKIFEISHNFPSNKKIQVGEEKPQASKIELVSNLINKDAVDVAWIVENFYTDPDYIRKIALDTEYSEGGFGELGRGYIGRRTFNTFFLEELKPEFEKIMQRKIENTSWNRYPNGCFQICYAGEPLVYHADSQQWAALIYLTPEAPYRCGTTLYAQKETGLRNTKNNDIFKSWPGGQNLDKTPYEEVDVFGNVFNRLVIYEASNLHAASEYFGYEKSNARLWQMFFFDTV